MKNGEKRRYLKIINDKPVKTAIFGVLQHITDVIYLSQHQIYDVVNLVDVIPLNNIAQKRKNGGYYEKDKHN